MKAGIYKLFDGGLIYVRKDRTVSAAAGTNYPIQIGAKVKTLEGGKYVLAETGDKQFQGDRHADVPNGCTDHQALVDSMHMAATLEPGQRVADYGTKFARVEEIDGTPDGITEDGNAIDLKTAADDPYKRMAEHMRGCEKAMRHVGEAATGAAEAVRRFMGVPPALAAPYGETDLVEWRKKFSASLRKQGFRICHTRSARKHKKQGHTVIPLHGGWYAWRPADYLHPYQRDALARFVSDERVTVKVPVGVGKSEAGVL